MTILSCVYLNDYCSDRLKRNTRCFFIIVYSLPNLAGAFGLKFVPLDQHVARLWCYYLTGPYNAAFVLILSLAIGNTAGHTKKVVTNAFTFLGYCAGMTPLPSVILAKLSGEGNIAGPFFYKSSQSPTYSLGIWSMIFSHIAEIILVLVFWWLMSQENKRRDHEAAGTDILDSDVTAFGDLTDRENPNFRYVY